MIKEAFKKIYINKQKYFHKLMNMNIIETEFIYYTQ